MKMKSKRRFDRDRTRRNACSRVTKPATAAGDPDAEVVEELDTDVERSLRGYDE
jgi:hypothetical protein